MTGEDAARQTAEKLRKESDVKKQEEAKKEDRVGEELQEKKDQQLARDDEELRRQMSESAGIGADSLSASLPILKIYTANKSADDVLADGSAPHDGFFLHKASGREWEDVYFHPMVISRGFYAFGVPDSKTGVKPVVFNNILGGVILNDLDYTPFIMYFTGTKLQNLWGFRDMIRPFIKRKINPIPMFCITASMNRDKFKTQNFGNVWIAKFDYERDENGKEPSVQLDLDKFKFLKTAAERMVLVVGQIIADKEITKDGESIDRLEPYVVQDAKTEPAEQIAEPDRGTATEHVNPDDLPF